MLENMRALIIVLLMGFCSNEEQLKTESKCSCILRLSSGHVLQKIQIPNDSVVDNTTNRCDNNNFKKCEENCNQTISNSTNGFDLDKPKSGESSEMSEMSLGQLYCNKIGSNIKRAQFMIFVTLECRTHKQIKDERNGTAVSIGSFISESSITRYIGSGFKQKIGCVDNKYTKIE